MATRKQSSNNTPMDFSAVVQARAVKRGKDADRTGKQLRAYIRSHNAELIDAGWKALADHNHGDRYPSIPRNVAQAIIDNGRVPSKS